MHYCNIIEIVDGWRKQIGSYWDWVGYSWNWLKRWKWRVRGQKISVGTQMASFGFLDVHTKEFAGRLTTAREMQWFTMELMKACWCSADEGAVSSGSEVECYQSLMICWWWDPLKSRSAVCLHIRDKWNKLCPFLSLSHKYFCRVGIIFCLHMCVV